MVKSKLNALTEATAMEDARTFVRDCMMHLGQEISAAEIEAVALKVYKAMKPVRAALAETE